MTEPERTGGKTRLVPITTGEAEAIQADGIGGPKLYVMESKGVLPQHFCEPAELDKWRAARKPDQA